MATEVTLDAQWDERFPDRCILCGCPGPGESFAVATRAEGGWSQLLGIPGQQHVASVPACSHCRQLLERQKALRGRGSVLAIISAVMVYAALVGFYDGPYANFVRAGGIVLFMAPYVVWEGLFPLPIRMRATPKSVTYVFEQSTYGREFALLNPQPNAFFYDDSPSVEHA